MATIEAGEGKLERQRRQKEVVLEDGGGQLDRGCWCME
jgi:hypothetical protein